MKTSHIYSLILALCLTFSGLAYAQAGQEAIDNYPNRSVTIINPFSPGGSSDIQARIISEALQRNMGQAFNVISKKGGAGAVAMLAAKNAKPDGYTMILTCLGPCSLTPNRANVGYNTPKDFRAIARISLFPFAVAVLADSGIENFNQLLEYAQRNPNTTFGTCGAGLMQHVLFSDFLSRQPDASMQHIPFNGGAEATSALLGGHVAATVQTASEYLPHYKSGTLRLLAITGDERSPVYPDVPTFKELGYETITGGTWFGFAVPKDTPEGIILKLQNAIKDALNDSEVQSRFEKAAIPARFLSGPELDVIISSEYKSFGKILKSSD
ncbi:tripartite tricarboxylate transporter substrate binding protein [Halodesulfovibrio sp. MK-HDV]|uniref:Bug family tripartite tricarboxylate transporter substrate binding protein n=1 Tax=Halodesulfovibrio sp. MK-HDV TaxID=2599925 RepID=UPI0013708FFB|nr:tripartite tricarboxylate transporter substrate binding protein [Halodesulfovibrio sp. MK-HDV]KAF1076996.1 hypothetical protein MKHDV_00592 [Halodesulfovibrio sp. MK-HDV]